jgi:ATP-binding cassette subfamily F protein uup
MPLIRLEEISLAYSHIPLLARVNFQIDDGERVCLVGRNGAGKTTLLRVITGAVAPDEGDVWHKETLRVAHLEQEAPPDTDQTIFEVVAGGLGELGTLLTEYHQMTHRADALDGAALRGLAQLQTRIETLGGWNINQRVETVLTRLSLPEDKRLSDCSGGFAARSCWHARWFGSPIFYCWMSRRIISILMPSSGSKAIWSIFRAR